MTLLSDYGANVYSQSLEDGVIAECLRRIGEGGRVCVEFGAGDGLGCSNTANLWHAGWRALLIEADATLVERLRAAANEGCTVVHDAVALGGEHGIDALIAAAGLCDVDFMSVDVDGDDWWICQGMACRPRLLCVEFNKTVPPHLDVQPSGASTRFGVGPLTMRRSMEARGYTMIGVTDANMFFVQTADADKFADLEKDLAVLLPPERFMYLATDFTGRVVPIGARPPWGLVWPPSDIRMVANQPDLLAVDSEFALERFCQQILGEIREVRQMMEDQRQENQP